MFWDRKPDMRYIHWVSTPLLRDRDEVTWLGKMKELKNFMKLRLTEQKMELTEVMNTRDNS